MYFSHRCIGVVIAVATHPRLGPPCLSDCCLSDPSQRRRWWWTRPRLAMVALGTWHRLRLTRDRRPDSGRRRPAALHSGDRGTLAPVLGGPWPPAVPRPRQAALLLHARWPPGPLCPRSRSLQCGGPTRPRRPQARLRSARRGGGSRKTHGQAPRGPGARVHAAHGLALATRGRGRGPAGRLPQAAAGDDLTTAAPSQSMY